MGKSKTMFLLHAKSAGRIRCASGLIALLMLAVFANRAAAQTTKTVHGTVVNSHNEPISDVSVTASFGKKGTATDKS